MLGTGFDGIFFGHTHKSYIGRPSVEILSELLSNRRKIPRMWTRLVPKFILRRKEKDCLASYKREAAKNGQLPSLSTYFDYLYLQQKGADLAGPNVFRTIRGFYEQREGAVASSTIAKELAAAKKKKVLISLAPGACQAEARWKGFHCIQITRDASKILQFEWDRYEYKNASFLVKPRNEHLS